MSVRVSDTWSVPRPVYGGVPQGSILGVLLFNIATDDLEDDETAGADTFIDDSSSNSSEDSFDRLRDEDPVSIGCSVTAPSLRVEMSSTLSPSENYLDLLPATSDEDSDSTGPSLRVGRPLMSASDSSEWAGAAPKISVTDEVLQHCGQSSLSSSSIDDQVRDPGAGQVVLPLSVVTIPPDVERESEGLASSSESDGGGQGVQTSTPIVGRVGRPRIRDSPLRPRGPRLTARDWSFMPGRRNRRRRRNLQRTERESDEF